MLLRAFTLVAFQQAFQALLASELLLSFFFQPLSFVDGAAGNRFKLIGILVFVEFSDSLEKLLDLPDNIKFAPRDIYPISAYYLLAVKCTN